MNADDTIAPTIRHCGGDGYDPVKSLQHYPLPMARYGLNPYGENLYRIVLTRSRRHLIGGCWPDGEIAYHWALRYPGVLTPWIMERWADPWQYCQMTKTQWDSTMVDPVSGWLINGPYPSRGEYDLVWQFDAGVAADSLDSIMTTIEHNWRRSFQDVRDLNSAQYEYEEKEKRGRIRDNLRDKLRPFGVQAVSSLSGVSRGTKTVDSGLWAHETGMPIPSRRPAKKTAQEFEIRSAIMAGGV